MFYLPSRRVTTSERTLVTEDESNSSHSLLRRFTFVVLYITLAFCRSRTLQSPQKTKEYAIFSHIQESIITERKTDCYFSHSNHQKCFAHVDESQTYMCTAQ